MSPARNSLSNSILWPVFLLFCLIGILVYYNSLTNPFHYDDIHHITTNPHIRKLSNVSSFFTDTGTFSSVKEKGGMSFHYRPLVMLTYAINYYAGELKPWGYHIVNLAFHIGTAFLIFLILKAMLVSSQQSADNKQKLEARSQIKANETFMSEALAKDNENPPLNKGGHGGVFSGEIIGLFAAISAGLIFLVHPFNSEIVNYISTRSSVMSGFFYLLAFYCWVLFRSQQTEERSKKLEARSKIGEGRRSSSNFLHLTSNFLPLASCFYLASLLAFAAGMLSKEVAITLPVMLWLYDMYRFKTVSSEDVRFSVFSIRTYIPYLPFIFLVVVPYIVIRASWIGKSVSRSQRDLMTQIFTEFPVLIKHWQMFIFPSHLSPIHESLIFHRFFSFQVISSFILLVLYAAILIFLLYKSNHVRRVISFFMLWFFIVLLPTSIVPLGLIFQEHRGYLAVVSFAVIIGIVFGELSKTKAQKLFIVLFVIFLGVYSYVTINRNKVWKDDLILWSDTVEKSPGSSVAHAGMGMTYKELGAYDNAIIEFQKAISLGGGGEDIFTAHQSLGQVYILQQKWDLAVSEYEKALKIYPNNLQIHNDAGIVYVNIGKTDLAERHFILASKIDPTDYLSFFNLGIFYTNERRLNEAVRAYSTAVSLSPDNMGLRMRLASAMEESGDKENAANMYRYVVQNAGMKDADIVQEANAHLFSTKDNHGK
ncbi:MAG: tetratricopeptide repeat protein [Nitrospirae bacterium]|nr:tetratricopeptide repeat protein [Nitrospirota bacterium]